MVQGTVGNSAVPQLQGFLCVLLPPPFQNMAVGRLAMVNCPGVWMSVWMYVHAWCSAMDWYPIHWFWFSHSAEPREQFSVDNPPTDVVGQFEENRRTHRKEAGSTAYGYMIKWKSFIKASPQEFVKYTLQDYLTLSLYLCKVHRSKTHNCVYW